MIKPPFKGLGPCQINKTMVAGPLIFETPIIGKQRFFSEGSSYPMKILLRINFQKKELPGTHKMNRTRIKRGIKKIG